MTAFNDFKNARVAALPPHLRKFIVEQDYSHYTALDQAVWRYVMRQNYNFLKDIAYYPYIPGLRKAGLSIETIPRLQEMNDALGKIGWGAVTVDGFIPPSAFMEYQAYQVLVIAADIRQLQHIQYTPAPDIIHESSGHAPIIAEPDYNRYLSHFGRIGAKAMFSKADFDLYEAIRALSILKEMPGADAEAVRRAQESVDHCQENMGEPSEMALLSRLHWWTVEYGLIGTLDDPKIYGAGLLSSISESANCLDPAVTKVWYTADAVNYSYDITRPQPQLFVTPDFQTLTDVLDAFAARMAFRTGGATGVEKAIGSGNVATVEYTSGLQVSGTVSECRVAEGEVAYLKFSGPVSLAVHGRELSDHGAAAHPAGFTALVGRLQTTGILPEELTDADLREQGCISGEHAELRFESGIRVRGIFHQQRRAGEKLILLTFQACTVSDWEDRVLFDPAWGPFHLAVGSRIASVFPGFADPPVNEERTSLPVSATFHPQYSDHEQDYHRLFARVRRSRETLELEDLHEVAVVLRHNYPEDWLCSLEIVEILETNHIYSDLAAELRRHLDELVRRQPELRELVSNGLSIAGLVVN